MYAAGHKIVYCRVGSLENYTDLNEQGQNVYCRVGSSESPKFIQ